MLFQIQFLFCSHCFFLSKFLLLQHYQKSYFFLICCYCLNTIIEFLLNFITFFVAMKALNVNKQQILVFNYWDFIKSFTVFLLQNIHLNHPLHFIWVSYYFHHRAIIFIFIINLWNFLNHHYYFTYNKLIIIVNFGISNNYYSESLHSLNFKIYKATAIIKHF